MSEDRKPPKPRAIRKDNAKAPDSDPAWAMALPSARVMPPVVGTLDSIHDTTRTLVDRVSTLVGAAPVEMTAGLAKTLLTLAQTVAAVQDAKRAARDDASELDELTEEELDAALEKAIEDRRRKRLGLPESTEGE
jgi:hypothetical protein